MNDFQSTVYRRPTLSVYSMPMSFEWSSFPYFRPSSVHTPRRLEHSARAYRILAVLHCDSPSFACVTVVIALNKKSNISSTKIITNYRMELVQLHTGVIVVAVWMFSIRYFNEQHTRTVVLVIFAGKTCELVFGKYNRRCSCHCTWVYFHWNGFELNWKREHQMIVENFIK